MGTSQKPPAGIPKSLPGKTSGHRVPALDAICRKSSQDVPNDFPRLNCPSTAAWYRWDCPIPMCDPTLLRNLRINRLRLTADLSPPAFGMKNGKYIQYSRIFHTLSGGKISRCQLSSIYSELPFLFYAAYSIIISEKLQCLSAAHRDFFRLKKMGIYATISALFVNTK